MGKKYLDLLERTAFTAVQAFFGVLAGLAITSTVDWDTVFVSAGIAALIAAAKCVVGFQVGNPESASVLPAADEPVPTKAKK